MEQLAASSKFIVRFGRAITRRFTNYHEAERFLMGLRFENDKGTSDIRDYRKDKPFGFENLANGGFRRIVLRKQNRAGDHEYHALFHRFYVQFILEKSIS
jgi:hypothetical protein